MKRQVQDWPIARLQKEQTRITFPEFQREKDLWSPEAKVQLIDSIFKDIDIPKLYFNLNDKKQYEVVDGQQRLWAIWEYLSNLYKCPIGGEMKRFADLSPSEKRIIENYKLQVTVFNDAEDEFLREHFARLQLGTPLVTGEKLKALTGKMKEFIFEKLMKFGLIKKLGIPKRRFAKQTLCAQICINSFGRKKNQEFQRTRWEDLRDFFKEYQHPQSTDLEFFNEQTEVISNVLNALWKCFGERAQQLKNRSYILSVYLLFEEFFTKGQLNEEEQQQTFVEFVLILWRRLREEAKAGINRKNRALYTFQTSLSSAPGEPYQIRARHKQLLEFYEYFKENDGEIKGD